MSRPGGGYRACRQVKRAFTPVGRKLRFAVPPTFACTALAHPGLPDALRRRPQPSTCLKGEAVAWTREITDPGGYTPRHRLQILGHAFHRSSSEGAFTRPGAAFPPTSDSLYSRALSLLFLVIASCSLVLFLNY